MTVQTTYDINHQKALVGQLGDLQHYEAVSKTVTEETDFGVVVSRGATDNSVSIGGNFLGITMRDITNEGINTGAVTYPAKATASVLRKGYIFVLCPSGCTPSDGVKYNTTTGVIDSGSAGAGENSLDEASWETSASAGDVALLRVFSASTTAGS